MNKISNKVKNFELIALSSAILLFSACSSKELRKEFPLGKDQAQTANLEKKDVVQPMINKSQIRKNDIDPIIEPGFLFEVSNQEDQKINGKFRVGFDSNLKLPYNVSIQTENLRLSEVKIKIINSYQKFFQTSSAMNVQLIKREYLIEVRGLVEKPGQFNMSLNESIESLISRAGGLKGNRDQKEYEPRFLKLIKRNKSLYSVSLRDYFKSGILPENFSIDGGDQLVFQVDAPSFQNQQQSTVGTIQILGEVARPGDTTFIPGADIYYYLQLVGGPNPGANLSDIKIIRGGQYQRLITEIDSFKEEPQPRLMAGDIVIIPYEKPTKLERGVSLGSGIASILSTLILIAFVF